MFCSAQWSDSGHELGSALDELAIVYSGLAHPCFWQCSESRFTGNLPVHDAPPICINLKLVLLHQIGIELGYLFNREPTLGLYLKKQPDGSLVTEVTCESRLPIS